MIDIAIHPSDMEAIAYRKVQCSYSTLKMHQIISLLQLWM